MNRNAETMTPTPDLLVAAGPPILLLMIMLLLGCTPGCATQDKKPDPLDDLRKQGYGFGNPHAEENRQKRLSERNLTP